jgi:hypothetical protein
MLHYPTPTREQPTPKEPNNKPRNYIYFSEATNLKIIPGIPSLLHNSKFHYYAYNYPQHPAFHSDPIFLRYICMLSQNSVYISHLTRSNMSLLFQTLDLVAAKTFDSTTNETANINWINR